MSGGLGRAVQIIGQDLRWWPRSMLVNGIGRSVCTPRLVRLLIYRLARLDIQTANVSEGCRFTGNGGTRIGRGTFVNNDCVFDAFAEISIGQNCAIAMQVTVTTSTHETTAEGSLDPRPVGRPVRIGDNCWIGSRSLILPGVTIGDGVIVAAGSVVTEDCQAGWLYAGVPAKPKRPLRESAAEPA
ncbi:MAG: acyltransferase [Jatrophihabitantaceae bacterium]